VKLPSGAFKPYTGVSTAILFFQKTSSGGTDSVWFYDVQADGYTLDDKRTPTDANDLPDVLSRWSSRPQGGPIETWPESDRPRTAKSFLIPKSEIAAQGYDLSLNRYKEVEHEEVEHRDPAEILAELASLEKEIVDATAELASTLSSAR